MSGIDPRMSLSGVCLLSRLASRQPMRLRIRCPALPDLAGPWDPIGAAVGTETFSTPRQPKAVCEYLDSQLCWNQTHATYDEAQSLPAAASDLRLEADRLHDEPQLLTIRCIG